MEASDGAGATLAAFAAAIGGAVGVAVGFAVGADRDGLGSARGGVGFADRLLGGDGWLIQSTALTTLMTKSATMPAPTRMSVGGEKDWARRRGGPESVRGAGLSAGVAWRSR